jgi:predicted ATPase
LPLQLSSFVGREKELAAVRTKVMSVEEIAERLDDSFGLLASGLRTAMPRQRTLRATMDWSHDLLGPAERTLFRRLSVFVGGFNLSAAESVCVCGRGPRTR